MKLSGARRSSLKASVSLFTVTGLLVVVGATWPMTEWAGMAQAAEHDHSSGSGDDHSDGDSHDSGDDHSEGGKGKGGKGGSGGHSDGDDHDHDDSDGHTDDDGHTDGDDHDGGKGKGGPDNDRGARKGQSDDLSDGRSIAAGEGSPVVELGRLNVARSPAQVLNRAYFEALSNITAETAIFYNMSISEAERALRTRYDSLKYIDSPLQNLALLRDVLEDGSSILNTTKEIENSNATLAAMFLGTASDKTIPIRSETALLVAKNLGFQMSEAQAATLAANAERIRIAILSGHGS